MFSGPIDTFENLAYLNVWAYIITFVSNLYQFRSANYEVEIENAKNSNNNKSFPDSLYYKFIALSTLEVAAALNLVNMVGFWFYVLPNSSTAYDHGQLEEAFGNNFLVQTYSICRNYIVHTLPFVITFTNTI